MQRTEWILVTDWMYSALLRTEHETSDLALFQEVEQAFKPETA